jgi:hypothetical protein
VRISFKPGDVASIYFPNQEDPSKATERFAIVIEDLGDEFILVPITKQLHQQSRYPNSILIRHDKATGKQMGLIYDSLIIIERAIQLPKLKITPPKIGTCPNSLLIKIQDKLEELGLP